MAQLRDLEDPGEVENLSKPISLWKEERLQSDSGSYGTLRTSQFVETGDHYDWR